MSIRGMKVSVEELVVEGRAVDLAVSGGAGPVRDGAGFGPTGAAVELVGGVVLVGVEIEEGAAFAPGQRLDLDHQPLADALAVMVRVDEHLVDLGPVEAVLPRRQL